MGDLKFLCVVVRAPEQDQPASPRSGMKERKEEEESREGVSEWSVLTWWFRAVR